MGSRKSELFTQTFHADVDMHLHRFAPAHLHMYFKKESTAFISFSGVHDSLTLKGHWPLRNISAVRILRSTSAEKVLLSEFCGSDTWTLPSGLPVLCSRCGGFPGLAHSCVALGNRDAHTKVEQLSVVVERFLGSVKLVGQS